MLHRVFQKSSPLLRPSLSLLFSFSKINSKTNKIDKKPNLYNLLQLQPNSTPDKIHFNYHRLVNQYNPTGSSDPSDHARLLNQAYVILSNQKLRAKYDLQNGFKNQNYTAGDSDRVEQNSRRSAQKQLKEAKSQLDSLLKSKNEKNQEKIIKIMGVISVICSIFVFSSSGRGQKRPQKQFPPPNL